MNGNTLITQITENKCSLVADAVNPINKGPNATKYGFKVDGKPVNVFWFKNEVNRMNSIKTKFGYSILIHKDGSDLFRFLELLKEAVQKAMPAKTVGGRCKYPEDGSQPYAFISLREYNKRVPNGAFKDLTKIKNGKYEPLPVTTMADVEKYVNYGATFKCKVEVSFCEVNGTVHIKPVITEMAVRPGEPQFELTPDDDELTCDSSSL